MSAAIIYFFFQAAVGALGLIVAVGAYKLLRWAAPTLNVTDRIRHFASSSPMRREDLVGLGPHPTDNRGSSSLGRAVTV